MEISKFNIIFDHTKKSIFWIDEFNKVGDIKISSSLRRRRNSPISVFNSIIQISIQNDLCIDYIEPDIWYIKIRDQLQDFINENLDKTKYSFNISFSDKTSSQTLLKKDFYYMNLYISFSITNIELEKEILQNKLKKQKMKLEDLSK